MKKPSNTLTDWESGQILVSCADHLSEKEVELRNGGRLELAIEVCELRLSVGRLFNDLGSHEFELPDGSTIPYTKKDAT